MGTIAYPEYSHGRPPRLCLFCNISAANFRLRPIQDEFCIDLSYLFGRSCRQFLVDPDVSVVLCLPLNSGVGCHIFLHSVKACCRAYDCMTFAFL